MHNTPRSLLAPRDRARPAIQDRLHGRQELKEIVYVLIPDAKEPAHLIEAPEMTNPAALCWQCSNVVSHRGEKRRAHDPLSVPGDVNREEAFARYSHRDALDLVKQIEVLERE
jgi:hypothetical protein